MAGVRIIMLAFVTATGCHATGGKSDGRFRGDESVAATAGGAANTGTPGGITAPIRNPLAQKSSEKDEQAPNDDAVAAAKTWLRALRDGSEVDMSRVSGLPLRVVSNGARQRCDRVAASSQELVAVVECIRQRDKSFLQSMTVLVNTTLLENDPNVDGAQFQIRKVDLRNEPLELVGLLVNTHRAILQEGPMVFGQIDDNVSHWYMLLELNGSRQVVTFVYEQHIAD